MNQSNSPFELKGGTLLPKKPPKIINSSLLLKNIKRIWKKEKLKESEQNLTRDL